MEDLMTTHSKNESENSSNDRELEEKMLDVFSGGHRWSDPHPWGDTFAYLRSELGPGERICLMCGRYESVLRNGYGRNGAGYEEPCEKRPVWPGDLREYHELVEKWQEHLKTTTSK